MFKYISFFVVFLGLNASTLFAQGYFYTEGTVTIGVASSIEIKGDAVINQPIHGDGFIVMNGDNPQYLSGSAVNTNNFKVANSAEVFLNNPLWVNDTLHMTSGILYLNNEHLYLGDNSIGTGNGGGYIETNSNGYVQRKIDNNPFTFHIGYGNEYFPITLSEMGTADTFQLQGWNHLPDDGTVSGTSITNHVALLSYSFTDLVTGGNDLNITMGWNDSKNAVDFAQSHAIGIFYNGSNYEEMSNCPTNVNSVDPNSVSYASINTTGTFGIGDSVYLSNIPIVYIQPGDTSICAGNAITFTAMPSGAASYEWSTSDTTQSINTGVANNYFVTIVDSVGCAYTSDVVTLTILSLPSTPIISFSTPTLSVDSTYASYQWFLNGDTIPGATNYQTDYTSNGSYLVVVTNINGCTATSDEFTISSSINNENNIELNVWGQYNQLIIDLKGDEAQQIFIYDALGKIVYHQKYSSNIIPLYISHGMYVVRILGVKGEYSKKIVW